MWGRKENERERYVTSLCSLSVFVYSLSAINCSLIAGAQNSLSLSVNNIMLGNSLLSSQAGQHSWSFSGPDWLGN